MNATKRLRVFWTGLLLAGLFFSGTALAVFAFAAPASAIPLKTPRYSRYVEGEALVLLRSNTPRGTLSVRSVESGVSRSYANNVAASVGARAETTYGALSAQSGKIFALVKSETKTTEELIRDLEKNPDVISAAPNYIVRAMETRPNDPSYTALWGMEKINAPKAWDKITGDSGVYVAVIDTGVDHTHPDLGDNTAAAWGWNFTTAASADFMDRHSHGTHVAGTIGAVGNNGMGVAGVNWTVKVIPIKVLSDSGSGDWNWIIGGVNKIVQYLTENPGMRIAAVNLSLGGWMDYTPEGMKITPFWHAFKALSDLNRTVIVVAAGNDRRPVGEPNPAAFQSGNSTIPEDYYVYPASFTGIANMIVVGATGSNNAAAAFTNFSETFVDLAAPGVGIQSTTPNNGYGGKDGTSMATPHVAGAVALLSAYRPDLTASDLKALLLDAANPNINPISNSSYNTSHQKVSSHGLLDIGAAIEAATIVPTVPVTGISIAPPTPGPLYTNDESQKTVTLVPTVSPANATIQTVHWTTSAPAVAAVDLNSGVVTAAGQGTARITGTATDGSGVSAYVDVEVRTYATGVSLNHASLELPPGGTATLVPTVTPTEADPSVAWSITPTTGAIHLDNGVVSVDTNAQNGDEAKVTVKATEVKTPDSVSSDVVITVKIPQKPVTKVTVTPVSLPLLKGATGQLTAQVEPADADNKSVIWSSGNTGVATVDQNGLVTAAAAGTTTITAKALDGSNQQGASSVTATNPPVPVSGITLDRYQLDLAAGTSYQLTASILPTNTDNKQVVWSAADASVASVAQNGLVSAHSAGTTTITAEAAADSTKRAQATVKVTGVAYVPVTSLTLSTASLSLKVGDAASRITPTVLPDNASNKAVIWVSARPAVATVTQDGDVTAVSPGSADITATAAGGTNVKNTVRVNVVEGTDPFVKVDGLTVAPSSLTLTRGKTGTLEPTLSPD
ncbi:MAG: Ig-like domain-containing protein, partial [Synergistaceae bacterium]|nr:Ig-like domain-containing protein [Synergistaceae bacterium]